MAESMIERMARALCVQRGRDPDQLEPGDDPRQNDTPVVDGRMPNGDCAHFSWREFENDARAVLAVMRQPGAWMVDEMCGAWMRNNREKLGVLMLRYWEAAIDAALVDDPGNPETQAMIDAALSEDHAMTTDIQEGDYLYRYLLFRDRRFWEFWKPKAMTQIAEISVRATPAIVAAGITFDDIRGAIKIDVRERVSWPPTQKEKS